MPKKKIESELLKGTIIIILVSILSKFSSFVSESILAAYLGTTSQSDAYYMVSSIQMVIYPMLGVGVWKIFLTIYKEKVSKNEIINANKLANKATTFFSSISIVVALLIFFFSDSIVAAVAPGFSSDEKKLCSELVKISSPMYIFITASAVYSSMLQCHKKFLGSQLREVASHIPTIVAALFFYNIWGIKTLAIALVVGSCLRLIIELPFVDWGYKFKPDFCFNDRDLFLILRRLPAALLSEGVTQINTLIDKVMASSLPYGAVSALNYGNKLANVFSGLLSTAVATALYPQVVELVSLNQRDELNKLMTKIINIFSIIMIPVTIACCIFSKELVLVVYERGVFDSNSTNLTAGIFSSYCLGLFFFACNMILSNIFYGYGDTRTPLYISIINMIVNVIGNIVFVRLWGSSGLAFSTSLSAMFSMAFQMFFVKKYVQFSIKEIVIIVTKALVSSVVACGIPSLLKTLLSFSPYLELIVALVIGVVIYLTMLRLFNVKELQELKKTILVSLGNKKSEQ